MMNSIDEQWSILEKFRGIYGNALNLDFSQVSGHLINLLRDPSIQGGASRAGILKETSYSPGWGVGSRPPGPHLTPPRPHWRPHRLPKNREWTRLTPPKSPAYRAQILRSPRIKPRPQIPGGGPGSGVGDSSSTLPARVEVPPRGGPQHY